MPTVNKALEALTVEQIDSISIEYLMGWHDLEKKYGFRVKGLNRRRRELGLRELTKEWSNEYRIDYIKSHFTDGEIHAAIFDYCLKNRVNNTRWVGIELLDCRFGREYAKLFKRLLGSSRYRKLSEICRVSKVMTTQHMYGGVGLSNPITKALAMNTNLQRYGVVNPMQRKDVEITSPFSDAEVQKKSIDTKALRVRDAMVKFKTSGVLDEKALRISQVEVIVIHELINRFGKDDVFYSYGVHPFDVRYPFNCDFYIKSLDLFIEMHTHYSHGKHWYDANDHDDKLRVEHLLSSTSKKSRESVRTWTEVDVMKRQKAMESGLNYLVFWDDTYCQIDKKRYPNLRDFYLWLVDYDCDYVSFIRDHPENTY